jgi:hypothetical protein
MVDATVARELLTILETGQKQSLAFLCDTMHERRQVSDVTTIDTLCDLVNNRMLVRVDDPNAIWFQLPEHNHV